MTGGTVNWTGTQANDAIGFNGSSYGITSNASSTTSLWSVPISLRGASGIIIAVAPGSTSSGIDLNISGNISSLGGAYSLTKTGGGTLQLSAINGYTGGTIIDNGSLVAGGNAASGANGVLGNATSAIALGDANSLTNSYTPSLLIGGNFTVARTITVGSATGSNSSTYTIGGSTDNNATFSGNISLNQSLAVSQVANTGSNALTISGVISSNNGSTPAVTFVGPGNINLTKANTYSGATTVSAGTLTLAPAAPLAPFGARSILIPEQLLI